MTKPELIAGLGAGLVWGLLIGGAVWYLSSAEPDCPCGQKCHCADHADCPACCPDCCPDGACPDGSCPDGKCPDGRCPTENCPDVNLPVPQINLGP